MIKTCRIVAKIAWDCFKVENWGGANYRASAALYGALFGSRQKVRAADTAHS